MVILILATTLPVADLSAPPSTAALTLAHLVDGGGWTTHVILINATAQTLRGLVSFTGRDGVPMQVSIGGVTAPSFSYEIQPGSVQRFKTAGAGVIRAGYAAVTPQAGQNAPVGAGLFSFAPSPGGVIVAEDGVPSASLMTAARIYGEIGGGVSTGIAIANPNSTSLTVNLQLFNSDGSPRSETGVVTIPANGQRAQFLNEIEGLTGLAPFQGMIRLSSGTPFLPLSLRTRNNSRGEFLITTLPAVSEAPPPSSAPVFFPHIATGDGWRTQIILIHPGGGRDTGAIRFFKQDGSVFSPSLQ